MLKEGVTNGKHVVSFRVNNEEKKIIDRWAKMNGLSTSSVLRAMFNSVRESREDVFGKYKANGTI